MRKIITIVVLASMFLGFGSLVVWSQNQKQTRVESIKRTLKNQDLNKAIAAIEENGQIADRVKGDVKKAKLFIIEYADFECSGCAALNPVFNQLIESYPNGEVAMVFRNYILPYHKNATAAAAAAEAAGNQGYWKKYADTLFANQQIWSAAEGEARTAAFLDIFRKISNNAGDLEKFKQDMVSKEVAKKISFDAESANVFGVNETPSLYINGQKINLRIKGGNDALLKHLRKEIDDRLAKK